MDRRKVANQSGKRQSVVAIRERKGRTVSFVTVSEGASVAKVAARIALGSIVYADEAAGWDKLHVRFLLSASTT